MNDIPMNTSRGQLLSLREMQSADLKTVMEIESRAHSHPWKQASFEARLAADNLCWLVSIENELVAYAIVSCVAGDAELLNIAVDPGRQGLGIASCLLDFMVARIVDRAENLFLEVRVSNRDAINLYEAKGFNEVGERRNYYPAAKGREDALIFALPLSFYRP